MDARFRGHDKRRVTVKTKTMPTYTVHEPPRRKAEAVSDPERFVFVRDGFYFWAFLLGPIWMLIHRLWLVLIGYIAVNVALAGLLHVLNAGEAPHFAATALLALLVGFEAGTLRRFSLRKWKTVGVVVAGDSESAERRFFARWVAREPVTPAAKPAPAMPPPVLRGAPSPEHVIGLFPEPGGSR
jgi:hypothetical protein